MQEEFYAIAFRKKIYSSIEGMQHDLDVWMNFYNTERTHTGKYCFGKTPMEKFIDSKPIAMSKQLQLLKENDNLAAISEAETGSAGEQPDRISLSSENEKKVEVLRFGILLRFSAASICSISLMRLFLTDFR
jgi:hypothetical protein